MGFGVQANRARRGGWGRERFVTYRPSPTLSDFNRLGPALGVGEAEVCYKQTQPDFSPTASLASPFPHPSKPPSQTKRLTKLIYMICEKSNFFKIYKFDFFCFKFKQTIVWAVPSIGPPSVNPLQNRENSSTCEHHFVMYVIEFLTSQI